MRSTPVSTFDICALTPFVQRGWSESTRPAALSTGFPALDACLPGGGLPEGRLVEIAGAQAQGRLTFALALAARLLERGEAVALIDPDGSIRPDVWRSPALERLLVVRGGGLLVALRAADALLRSRGFPLLLLDLPLPLLAAASLRAREAAFQRLAREARTAGSVVALLTERIPARADGLAGPASLRLDVRRGAGPLGGLLEVTLTRSKLGGSGARTVLAA